MQCENCKTTISKEKAYERDIHGTNHTFCCAECADKFELRTTGHLHH
ncbi:MAG: transcriptional regulator [Nitrososphaerales archaeon]